MGPKTILAAALALGAVGASAAAPAPQRPAPAAPTVADGRAIYMANCASCHGMSAHGDGPVAEVLRIRPADLTQLAKRNGGVFPAAQAQRIVDGRGVGAHGNPDMPIWGSVFKASGAGLPEEAVKARIAAIVKYLESIQERVS